MIGVAPKNDGPTIGRRAAWLRKAHSLSGLVPVGVFLVYHLGTNARALAGRASFEAGTGAGRPLAWPIELFGIALPLGFHAVYGVVLSFRTAPAEPRYPSEPLWMFPLQRLTGLVALLFLTYHLLQLRLERLFGTMGPIAFFPTLSAALSSTAAGVPVGAIAYLVGLAATVIHFGAGVFGFNNSWGITVSPRARRLSAAACTVLGSALFVLGARTVLYFATGIRFLTPGAELPACEVEVAPGEAPSGGAPAAIPSAR